MTRALTLLIGLFILLGSSCTQKMICPAYQSSFIYDKETLRKKFSYFKEDSTPKILTASKTKYLVAVPESYRKKMRGLKTVEMKPVYPVIPDSLKIEKGEDKIMLEGDVVDSTAYSVSEDSVYAITKTKEKYNVDQDIYMWYFRDQLVLPDVRAAMDTQTENRKAAAEKGTKKKKGFFAKLFKKKSASDSTAVEEELPATPSDTTAAPPKKKGIMGLFGGKKKKDKPADPAKKKEDAKKEDDGF